MSPEPTSAWTVFWAFLRLGLTSFGGPVAHLAYFREEFVNRRRWMSERAYADVVALCQFLPGPASSQVGMALGLNQAGYRGALAAWLGFTLPSALLLILFALGLGAMDEVISGGALQGLKVAAVAVVAQAVWGMARQLCPDAQRVTFMALTAAVVLLVPTAWVQVGCLLLAGVAGVWWLPAGQVGDHEPLPQRVGRRAGALWLVLFFGGLLGLPLLAFSLSSPALQMADAFYRAGSLVFGGGHVVLPLLQAELVPTGWVNNDVFLAGYGAAQAVPGPLFTFAAFLGASSLQGPTGWWGGALALVAIFLPSFLLVVGALPFWEVLRSHPLARAALAGVNAAVVGLLLAALYHPVWTSAIVGVHEFILALLALVALMFWRLPPWLVVLGCAVIGWAAA
ncbi:chromate efflux transporter [Tepidicella baoligensis]|uniref:chromate efflux transporter n=1 Tax=Tepidicella baoligensis TaxID=2707016 RepID=UPI0015DB69C6|nr:chromate efflux transporter [Tepidicella baoligensis]